jgi:hypothetical protein
VLPEFHESLREVVDTRQALGYCGQIRTIRHPALASLAADKVLAYLPIAFVEADCCTVLAILCQVIGLVAERDCCAVNEVVAD